MKRILPIAVGAAIIILAATTVKRRRTEPLPERPAGDWEPAGDEIA